MNVEDKFNIQIDPGDRPDKARFINGVRDLLTKVLGSQAGRALAASLRYQDKAVLLVPYDSDGPGDSNAQESWWGAKAEDNFSTVAFTPGVSGCVSCSSKSSGHRFAHLPQEVLFHELVHSLRRTSGHMHKWNLAGSRLASYTHSEEFVAILTTNIYISDVTNHHKTGLRADHQGHEPLDPRLAGSFKFFSSGTKAFNLIANFCEENHGFTTMLSHVHAPFNPVKAYLQNRQKAFDIAAGGDADNYLGDMAMDSMFLQDDSGTYQKTFAGPNI